MLHISPQQLEPALSRAYLKSPVETSVNGFLVNTGSKLVLVDTGAGTLFGPTLGRLPANLQASGYRPEQVDEIKAFDGDIVLVPGIRAQAAHGHTAGHNVYVDESKVDILPCLKAKGFLRRYA